MRALIVDDEPLARRGVILRLRKFKDVEIVGECGDGASAVEKIMDLSPDVVFLDVQMPGMDGFDVLRALPREKLPAVIFLTAHEQHALRAFEFHALDYLLKPLHDERFAAAISRARKLMDSTLKASMASVYCKCWVKRPKSMSRALQYKPEPEFRSCWRTMSSGLALPGIMWSCTLRPLSSVSRNDGFAGAEARPGKIYSHTSFANCAGSQHCGAAIHREPRIHRQAFGRLRTPLQSHLR